MCHCCWRHAYLNQTSAASDHAHPSLSLSLSRTISDALSPLYPPPLPPTHQAFLAFLILAAVFLRRRKQQIRGSFKTKVRNSQRLPRSSSGGSGGGVAGIAGTFFEDVVEQYSSYVTTWATLTPPHPTPYHHTSTAPAALAGLAAGSRTQKKNGFHRFEDEETGASGATAVEMGPNSQRGERAGSSASSFTDAASAQFGTAASSSPSAALPAPSSAPSVAPGQQQPQPQHQAPSSQASLDRSNTLDEATDRI